MNALKAEEIEARIWELVSDADPKASDFSKRMGEAERLRKELQKYRA